LRVSPVVVDVFDAAAVTRAVATARPDVIIHQLTDLPSAPGTPGYPAAQQANRRLRIEGTANLMQAARRAGVRRAIAQSIAFIYAPGEGTRSEDDLLAEDDGAVSIAKAMRDLGFDPSFRIG
jgi:nucleoside-diphosphate-sugar epimerase